MILLLALRRLAAFLWAGTIAGPSLLEPQQLQTGPVTPSSTMRPAVGGRTSMVGWTTVGWTLLAVEVGSNGRSGSMSTNL